MHMYMYVFCGVLYAIAYTYGVRRPSVIDSRERRERM
jgi:hypothetical protein